MPPHPLLQHATKLLQNSVAPSTRKAYRSSWRKWEHFHLKSFQTLPSNTYYRTLTHQHFLEKLMMFVSFCTVELQCNIRSMPGIMSALKWEFLARIVVTTAFNDPLLQAVMKGVAKLPSTPHRVRLPCTLDMINHIITINTTDTASMNQLMLATGVAIAYFLCLRSSEYVSKTIVPIEDSHQFRSTDVEFLLNDDSNQLIASNNIVSQPWSSIKLVKFSLLHAKNIRRDFGVPIWFSSTDATGDSVPFVQLVYLWASLSHRLDDDPFLSFRTTSGLTCLLYKQIQVAVQSAAREFGLTGKWFNTQSIRMSAPTIAAAANARSRVILQMGRWASKPAALLYQHQSTAANNNMLSIVSDRTLFTTEDILLSRVLASRAPDHQPTVRRCA